MHTTLVIELTIFLQKNHFGFWGEYVTLNALKRGETQGQVPVSKMAEV